MTKSIRFSLRFKMICLMALLLLGVTASVTWLSSRPFIEENQSLILELNSEVSVKTATQLSDYFQSSANRLSFYGKDFFARSSLSSDSDYVYVALFSNDASGRFSAEKAITAPGIKGPDPEWFIRWKEILEKVSQGEVRALVGRVGGGKWTIGLAIPYVDQGQEFTGRILVGFFNPEQLQEILGESDQTSTLLVDTDGILIASSSGAGLEIGSTLSTRKSVKAFLERKFNNGESRGLEIGPRKAILSTFRLVPFGNLGLITEVPEDMAFGAVKKVQYRALLVAIIIFCLAFLIGHFQSESITRPIGALARAAKEIAQGHFEAPIAVKANNEIGDLANAFTRMKNELRAREEALVGQEKLATAGRIARNIGHEFGNILQPMLIKLDVLDLELSKAGDDRKAKAIQDIIQIATLGSEICRGLMTLAREQPDATKSTPFLVSNTVIKAVNLLAHELKVKDIRPVLELEEGLLVFGVESQVLQVLINLIINALHASQNGAKLTIRTKREGEKISLEVIDGGSGIKPEHLPRIFDPLFSTKGSKGNGLGLSIAKAILEQHHGKISCESQVGVGTRMTLEFPFHSQQRTAA